MRTFFSELELLAFLQFSTAKNWTKNPLAREQGRKRGASGKHRRTGYGRTLSLSAVNDSALLDNSLCCCLLLETKISGGGFSSSAGQSTPIFFGETPPTEAFFDKTKQKSDDKDRLAPPHLLPKRKSERV